MSLKEAWLFPGQGAQYPGMGRLCLAQKHDVLDLLALAERVAGTSVDTLLNLASMGDLRRPGLAELSLTLVSLANARVLRAGRYHPSHVAGYSAGETAALCSAGVLTEEEALRASLIRGRVLERFVTPLSRTVAVAGLPRATCLALIRGVSTDANALTVAAYNTIDHLTVVGTSAAVASFSLAARSAGGRVSDVEVSGPWHSECIRPGAVEIHAALRALSFQPPALPIFMSASGRSECDPDRIRWLYAEQVCAPVLWSAVLDGLARDGVKTFVDVGPGKALYGFLLRTRTRSSELSIEAIERMHRPTRRSLETNSPGEQNDRTS